MSVREISAGALPWRESLFYGIGNSAGYLSAYPSSRSESRDVR